MGCTTLPEEEMIDDPDPPEPEVTPQEELDAAVLKSDDYTAGENLYYTFLDGVWYLHVLGNDSLNSDNLQSSILGCRSAS